MPDDAARAKCLIGEDAVRRWYQRRLAKGQLRPDPAQERLVERLQLLADGLIAKRDERRRGYLDRLLGRARPHERLRGLYVHGAVGRGKSFLVDGFFLNLQRKDKLRAHYHGFMQRFHAEMARAASDDDGLAAFADRLADRHAVLCLDEFHVSDIADAMILGRLLERLLGHGVVLVATSNYPPAGLYPNGLARDRFLPAIRLLEERLEVFDLDGPEDYRLRTLEQASLYYHPLSPANQARLKERFGELAKGMNLRRSVRVGSRRMRALRRTSDALWLDFAEACGGSYGQGDYLSIAARFATVFLSGVPRLGREDNAEATRRFTWMIDVLYEARTKLLLLAEAPLDELYAGAGGESGRTLSRLREMQSREYLESAGRPPAAAPA